MSAEKTLPDGSCECGRTDFQPHKPMTGCTPIVRPDAGWIACYQRRLGADVWGEPVAVEREHLAWFLRRLAAPPLPQTVEAVLRAAKTWNETDYGAPQEYATDAALLDAVTVWIAAGRPGIGEDRKP